MREAHTVQQADEPGEGGRRGRGAADEERRATNENTEIVGLGGDVGECAAVPVGRTLSSTQRQGDKEAYGLKSPSNVPGGSDFKKAGTTLSWYEGRGNCESICQTRHRIAIESTHNVAETASRE